MNSGRVLFHSHDVYGFGHLWRTATIAGDLARRRPDAALLVLTGMLQTHLYDLPANVDFIKLPTASRHHIYADVPAPDGIWSVREELIHTATTHFRPDVVLVDDQPDGPRRELRRSLASLRAARPRPELLFGIDCFAREPEVVKWHWRRDGIYDLLEQTYDRILVYGDRAVFDLAAEFDLLPAVAAKMIYTGYLVRDASAALDTRIRERLGADAAPLIVVTVGGGHDGKPIIEAYLQALHEAALAGVVSFVVTGPLGVESERFELERAAAELPDVTLVTFAADLLSYFLAADLVVTMGGYNTLSQLAGLGKRAVVVPRSGPGGQDQLRRARRFAQLGMVTALEQADLVPAKLARAIGDALVAPPPTVKIDTAGIRRTGEILEAALNRADI